MAPASYSSSIDDRGSFSPESNASTNLTDITSRKSSGSLFSLDAAFRSEPVDKDSILVVPVPDNEHYDPMYMSAWRIWAARLIGLSAVAPELLALFLSRYQLGELMARWKYDQALTAMPMLISLGLLSNSMVGCCECPRVLMIVSDWLTEVYAQWKAFQWLLLSLAHYFLFDIHASASQVTMYPLLIFSLLCATNVSTWYETL